MQSAVSHKMEYSRGLKIHDQTSKGISNADFTGIFLRTYVGVVAVGGEISANVQYLFIDAFQRFSTILIHLMVHFAIIVHKPGHVIKVTHIIIVLFWAADS